LPDLQATFADVYGEDLVVVALDPDPDDDIAGVSEFVYNQGVTYPVGLETTSNYSLFQKNFDGANPYPTDVIIDKQGIIRFVAVEYDPAIMEAVVKDLLAE
jgi:hypothetical protein